MAPTNGSYPAGDAIEVWISYFDNGNISGCNQDSIWKDNLFGEVVDESKGIYQMVFGIDNSDEKPVL